MPHERLHQVLEWLKREQLGYWKQQLRKRTELFEEAKREYNRVRYNTGHGRKPSALDEKRAMERARRLKEEAEQKIVAVKRWTLAVDHDAGRAFRPCARLSSMLSTSKSWTRYRMRLARFCCPRDNCENREFK